MGPRAGFTLIVNDGLGPGSVSEVPESSLPHWHRAGWRLATDAGLSSPPPDAEAAADTGNAETTEES